MSKTFCDNSSFVDSITTISVRLPLEDPFILRDFYFCAPGSLALLIHPHSVNFCSLFPTPLPETLRTGYNGRCRRVNAFDR